MSSQKATSDRKLRKKNEIEEAAILNFQTTTVCDFQIATRSFHIFYWKRTAEKRTKLKNARAKRAILLIFIIKYTNLRPSRLPSRPGYLIN